MFDMVLYTPLLYPYICVGTTSVYINLFLANVPILYPQKTPENLWFSGVLGSYKTRTLARNGLNSKSTFVWHLKLVLIKNKKLQTTKTYKNYKACCQEDL